MEPGDSFRDVTKFLLKSSVGCLLGIKKKLAASFRLDMLKSLKADLIAKKPLSIYQCLLQSVKLSANGLLSWIHLNGI